MNRFDRITSILIHLQSRRVVTAQSLAGRFEVSLRTIYRDIRTLEEAGVPILSEAGVGYSIMDGYRLPPVMFTREEAVSFVASEKLMEKFTDQTTRSFYKSALYKIKAVLGNSEKEILERLDTQIEINPGRQPFNAEIPDTLDILLKGIAEQKAVRLTYKSFYAEDVTERMIEPVGLFHEHNYWYVVGYCHLREDYRHFRTDRMEGISLTSRGFTKSHGDMNEYRRKPLTRAIKYKVVLSLDKIIYPYLKERRHYYGYESEEWKGNDRVEMTFLTENITEGFPRWLIMFADHVKIIEPEALKERLRELLKKIEKNL